MAHIFFERLEKRQSTQSLIPSLGGNTVIAIYSAPVPEYAVGWGGYTPSNPIVYYGINPPSSQNPFNNYNWWGGGLFGYSPWSNPSSSYNPWGSWGYGLFGGYGGYGNWSSPFGGFFGGFFGGLFGGTFPWSWKYNNPWSPIRLLYGISPTPQPLYGVGITPSLPTDIIAYYGIGLPTTSFGSFF